MPGFFELYLRKFETEFQNQTAFQWYDSGSKVLYTKSYGEFATDIRKFAAFALSDIPGIDHMHVALMGNNTYNYAVAAMGLLYVGAVVAPLNYLEKEEDLKWKINHADISMFFCDEACAGYFERRGISLDIASRLISGYSAYTPVEAKVLADEKERLALLVFTSGTSGLNKCVMLTHENLVTSIVDVGERFADIHEEMKNELRRYYMVLPMYHIFGFSILLQYPYYGKQINICSDIRYLYRDLKMMDSDFTCVVPVILNGFHKDLLTGNKEKLGSIKAILCGGASLDGDSLQLFTDNGIHIVQGYGMTETFAVGSHNIITKSGKPSAIGKFGSVMEVQVIDGEICLRSAAITPGYYKDPEETAALLTDGWLHTGDLGYIDEDECVFLTGRKKNLIILASGENISPEELEATLGVNEKILEVLVREKDSKICAVIYCAKENQEEVRKYVADVNKGIAFYKRITLVEFSEEPLEKTATGKIKRW